MYVCMFMCAHVPVLGLQVDVSCPTGVLGNFGHLQGLQVFPTAEPPVSPAPISHQKQHLSCCLKCRREKISYWVVTCFWKSVRWFFFFFCFGGGGVGVCVCVWILSLDFFFYWLNVEESKWNFVIILNSAGDVVVSAFWVVTCKSHFYFIRIPGAVYKWRRTKTGRLISETSYLFIYFNNR